MFRYRDERNIFNEVSISHTLNFIKQNNYSRAFITWKEMHHIHLKKIILILNNMIQVLSSNIKILVFKAYTNTIFR